MFVRNFGAAVLLTAIYLTNNLNVHAAIAVKGGSIEQQSSVQTMYTQLPACCQTDTTVHVQILDSAQMDTYLRTAEGESANKFSNSAIDGVYQNRIETITLRASDNTDVAPLFAHEYGHFVWNQALTPIQRDQYRAVYAKQSAAHSLVTPYAAQCVEEGFAEAYSFYVRCPATLSKCDSLSCSCLNEWMSKPFDSAASASQ